tara:strand:- start:470 stop:871 length:402 start_codon:yes stop_codon:yes gene_type:complete
MAYIISLIPNRMSLRIQRYIPFLVLFFSCSYIQSLNQPIVDISYERKFNQTDQIPIFYIGDPVPDYYAILGEIHVMSGDYELNEACSYESAIDKLIIKSFDRGGDAIKIISVKGPDEQNICFRMTALSLSYNK